MACNAYSWEQFKSLKLSKGKYYLSKNNMEPTLVIGRRRKKNRRKKKITKEIIENVERIAVENSAESREWKVVPSSILFLTFNFLQEEEEKNFITESFTLEKGEKMIAIKVHVIVC
jgi:hypothetical protein